MLFYNLSAVTEGGESLPCASPDFVTGSPSGLPLVESFANAAVSGDGLRWAREKTDMGYWTFWLDGCDGEIAASSTVSDFAVNSSGLTEPLVHSGNGLSVRLQCKICRGS